MKASRDVRALSVVFAGSGILHFLAPKRYVAIVPKPLPHKRALVYSSGAAELVCAVGLLHPRTRVAAGWASAVLLAAVFPANVQMAVDAQTTSSTAYKMGTLVRLPMQLPMIRSALRAARRPKQG